MNKIKLEEQILHLENQLVSAMKNADIDVLDRLLHEDLLFVLPSGETITKHMDLETYRSGTLIIMDLKSTVDEIRIFEDLAITTITNQLRGKYLENSFEGKFKYIRVWKLYGNQWQIIAGSGIQI